ncbi:MAG: ABC transporter ATP-binding protein [Proteobacteria bacterium]|nr:ABC transporter ATP-binding protein [Pseudomonadota bacterium]
MLDVKNINVFYGGIHAIKDVNINLKEKHIVSIIGANGAGKSTLLKAIMTLVPIKSGEIYFLNKRIDKLSTQDIVRAGISLVPEGRMLFTHLTVRDNLLLGSYSYYRKISKTELYKKLDRVYELFPILKERKKQISGTMSGGQQQMLAIGRALMTDPSLLLLDEPSMGLAPLVVREIFKVIKYLNEEGMSIIMVEQNARAALKLSHYSFVLEVGEVVGWGDSSHMINDEKIKRAYLGG